MVPRLILAIMAVLLVSACSSTGSFCDTSAPIRPSSEDVLTEGTARQILVHNQTGAGLCRWRP